MKTEIEIIKERFVISAFPSNAPIFSLNETTELMRAYAAQFHEWRPIEEAPKDWSKMLLFIPEYSYVDEFGEDCYSEDEIAIGYFSCEDGGTNRWVYDISGVSIHGEPTHFLPLPPPPQTPQP